MRRHISGREATYMAIESDKRGPVKIEPLPEGNVAGAASPTPNCRRWPLRIPVRSSWCPARHGKGHPEFVSRCEVTTSVSHPQLTWKVTESHFAKPSETHSRMSSPSSCLETDYGPTTGPVRSPG